MTKLWNYIKPENVMQQLIWGAAMISLVSCFLPDEGRWTGAGFGLGVWVACALIWSAE